MRADEIAPGIHRLEKVAPSGWCWNQFLVKLPSGGLLIHSPTWAGDGTFEAIEAVGTPEILFAPNHFHHMSLPRFRERWPSARVVASKEAIVRLTKNKHAGLVEIGEVESLLPPGARVIRPEHVKNGEVWLSLPGEGGPTWIVSDAWFAVERDVTGFQGFMLRRLRIVPGLRVGRTWRYVAIGSVDGYRRWATEALRRERPRRLLLSHGEPVEGADLADRLEAAMDRALG